MPRPRRFARHGRRRRSSGRPARTSSTSCCATAPHVPSEPATGPRPEEPDEWRTCFERDRDRILHAPAFRRLAGKTQVFVFPDDHQRTRLTHALEVAQVATSVARTLGLNVALTEAIALGHDCGHGPGGHASEDALSPYVAGRLRPRGVGRRRHAGAAEPVRRDARRHPQPLVEPPGARDAGGRGRVVGRPHRLRVPRLRGRRGRRHRRRRHAAGGRRRALRTVAVAPARLVHPGDGRRRRRRPGGSG